MAKSFGMLTVIAVDNHLYDCYRWGQEAWNDLGGLPTDYRGENEYVQLFLFANSRVVWRKGYDDAANENLRNST